MVKLTRITGETLTLKFNPQGALSDARLGGRDVTPFLRYVRKEDCLEHLELFGFRPSWETQELKLFARMNESVEDCKLSVFNAQMAGKNQFDVFLCDARDPSFIHKKTKAVMRFDSSERRFTDVVRLFEVDGTTCRNLLSERVA